MIASESWWLFFSFMSYTSEVSLVNVSSTERGDALRSGRATALLCGAGL